MDGEAYDVQRSDRVALRLLDIRRSRMNFLLHSGRDVIAIELTGAMIRGTIWPGARVRVTGVRTKRGLLRASRIVDADTAALTDARQALRPENLLAIVLLLAPVFVVLPVVLPRDLAQSLAIGPTELLRLVWDQLKVLANYLLPSEIAALAAAFGGWMGIVCLLFLERFYATLAVGDSVANTRRWAIR